MKNLTLSLITTLFLSHGLWAQNVDIPDPNFKAALLANPAINTNGDGEIQVAEAEGYEGAVLVPELGIRDLTGIEAFIAIDSLDCSENLLSNLDISSNSALTYLNTAENFPISHLDLSAVPNLQHLNCSTNSFTNLDVSSNPVLEYLDCGGNQLSSLDVSTNLALRILNCGYNQIWHLDLSNNPNLVYADCDGNNLITLNVQNGNNANMHLSTEDNGTLRCIQVDDPEQAREDWHYDTAYDAIYSTDCNAEVVYIPDPNFKAALVNNPQINTNGDDEIQITETPPYRGVIKVSGLNILDLTGIESFTWIDSLDCSDNQISSLDLSENRQLVYLNCSNNQLPGLNVGRLSWLRHLDCSKNSLTALNVRNSDPLEYLDCSDNRLPVLHIISHTHLNHLDCSNNQLGSLYADSNVDLEYLNCTGNQLSILHVQNGNNIHFNHFDARSNPGLSCIQVDDPEWAAANWSSFAGPAVSFNLDCPVGPVVYIPDAWFKTALLTNPAINTFGDGEIQVFEAQAYEGPLWVAGRNIRNLTGIEAFPGIDSLDCAENRLENLDLSGNPGLVYLSCNENHVLASLNVSSNPDLTVLNCHWNSLTSLNVSNNPALRTLRCQRNNLTGLNVSANPALEGLYCYFNNITSLDVRSNPNLKFLHCYDNEFPGLDVSSNPLLEELYCRNGQLTSLDVSNNPALEYLECYYNRITSLDVSNNPTLKHLNCFGNRLRSLYISPAPTLEYLNCSRNELTVLGLSGAPVLNSLNCSDNRLELLNVQNENNSNFSFFYALDNPSLDCIQVDDPDWAAENWSSTADPNISFSEECNPLQVVYIPDPNFKAILVNDPTINITNDEEIQVIEARAYSGSIEVTGEEISDLTGIEAFTAIEVLNCSNNGLTGLDVSANSELTRLDCSNNQLTSLDVRNGNNIYMQYFDARNNPDLTCIQVDYSSWASTIWGDRIDSTATFSTDCEATTSTAAPPEKASLSVYPNPTTGELTLALGATYPEVTVEVKDVMGRTLARKNYETTDQLDLTLDGPAGLYFVTVKAGNKEFIPVRVVKY